MAVPGNTNFITCNMCFARNPLGVAFCQDCGAKLDESSEGSDQEVYADLARANLLRMRGQRKESIDVVLGILRRFPNNVSAHTLLGDIYYEQDDLKQAAEWYEMAVDLNPEGLHEKEMLARIQSRLKEREARQSVQNLGVPQKQTFPLWYIGVMAGLILVIGVGAFAAGRGAGGSAPAKGAVAPLVVPATQEPAAPNAIAATPVEDDAAALTALQRGQSGLKLIAAQVDPSSGEITVTAEANPDQPADVVALSLAADVFVFRPDTKAATLRLVRDGKLTFVGRITRDQYDEAQSLSARNMALEQLAAQVFTGAWTDGRAPVAGSPTRPAVETTDSGAASTATPDNPAPNQPAPETPPQEFQEAPAEPQGTESRRIGM